jgi:vacuolar-type H+-ATPase subunit I/STV1
MTKLFTAHEEEEYEQALAKAQEKYQKLLAIARELYAEGLLTGDEVYRMVDTAGERIFDDATWLPRHALARARASAEKKAEEEEWTHEELQAALDDADGAYFAAIRPAEEACDVALDEAERIGKA